MSLEYGPKMLRNFVLFFLSVHCVFGDRSVTIVVDTTGSMQEEIVIFKNNLAQIMQAMVSGHFANYILLPFLHSGPGPHLTSQSPQGLVDIINAIEVSERYGCRENSLSAIIKALEVSKPRSMIFVFTDAEAHDTDRLYSVQNLCERRQSKVVIFQSGSCSQDPTTENIYKDIVTSCGGSYFFFYLNDLQLAFKYMREISKVDWSEVISHKEFYGNKEYSFSMDAYTKDLLVAISGYKPEIEIKNSFGETVRVDELIATSHMKVVRISKAMLGVYTADISCQSATLMTVYRKKEFKFRHGFSPLQPNSLGETTLLPIPGIMNYLLISLPDNNLQLVSIHLRIFDENDHRIVNHTAYNENRKLYAATILIESEKSFQILVKCRDGNNIEVSGTSNQMEPQRLVSNSQRVAPQAEILDIDPLIDYGKAFSLACKVNSYPKPEIWWENSLQEKMHSQSALLEIPHVYISYVSINVTKNETITCKCKNADGEDAIDAHIYVNRTFTFDVIQTPSDITIDYGSEGKLYCEVNAYPEAEIKWYHNDTVIENLENMQIIPEEQALLINNMNLDTTGKYECKISNTVESRTFSAEVYVSGLEIPQVTLQNSEILLKAGEQTEQQCTIIQGKPLPEVSWKYKSTFDNILSEVPDGVMTDGAALKIDSANSYHTGFYVCEAINIIGMDEKQVSVKIQYPPKIRNGDEIKDVSFGEAVELPCDVETVSEAVVHWDMFKGDVIIPFDGRHSTDYKNTHRFIANKEDSGTYVCTAENNIGSATRTVTINVLVAPYIQKLTLTSLTAGTGSTEVLNCNVISGNPIPSSRWEFSPANRDTKVLVRSDSEGQLELVLTNITRRNEGSYQCIAENVFGSDSVKLSLKVI